MESNNFFNKIGYFIYSKEIIKVKIQKATKKYYIVDCFNTKTIIGEHYNIMPFKKHLKVDCKKVYFKYAELKEEILKLRDEYALLKLAGNKDNIYDKKYESLIDTIKCLFPKQDIFS